MLPVIEVRELTKQYRYSHAVSRVANARELLMRALTSPFKRESKENKDPDKYFMALDGINFNVDQGEIVGIIGANGAGKSTLLKILSRITDPTSGTVTLRGRMASLLEVGTGFHPELTGRENIFLNGAMLGMRNAEIKAKFDEIVAFSEVEKFLDMPVKHYSSGMTVRLGFAVAAHLQPEILVVDEVLAVGDVSFQKKCLGKMSEVSKSGRTVLFVSHNMAAVENLCGRGIVLEHGHQVFDGDVKSAVQRYLANASKTGDGDGHVIDLSEAETRKPQHASILKRVELFTTGDRPAPRAVQLGAPLKMKIHMELPEQVQAFSAGVGFNSIFGQRVLTLHTQFEPKMDDEPVSGKTVLVCDVPSMTLVPGEYSLFIYVNYGGQRRDEVADAVMLSVRESDYYGTGKNPLGGVFVVPQKWSVERTPGSLHQAAALSLAGANRESVHELQEPRAAADASG